MREDTLRRYFVGEVSASELAADLRNAVTEIDPKVFRHTVEGMNQTFEVTADHLLKLCDAVHAHAIPFKDLQPIAFCLISSDNFDYSDKRISEVLFHWDNPEINFPLNETNLISGQRALRGHVDVDFQTADGRTIRLFMEEARGSPR